MTFVRCLREKTRLWTSLVDNRVTAYLCCCFLLEVLNSKVNDQFDLMRIVKIK